MSIVCLILVVLQFDAVGEVEGEEWIVDVVIAAGLHGVIYTLLSSVLASEGPGVTVGILMGVSVRDQSNICHVQEALGSEGCGKRVFDHVLASGALGLIVELNLDLLSEGGGSRSHADERFHIN